MINDSLIKEYEGAVAKARLIGTITDGIPNNYITLLKFGNIEYPTGIIYISKKDKKVRLKKFKYTKISFRHGVVDNILAEQASEKTAFGAGRSLFGLLDLEGNELVPVKFRGIYELNTEVYAGATLNKGLELYRNGEMVAYLTHPINLSEEEEPIGNEKYLTVLLDYARTPRSSSLIADSEPQELNLWCIYGRRVLYYRASNISHVIKVRNSDNYFYDLYLYYNNAHEVSKVISVALIMDIFFGRITPAEEGV